MPLLNSYDSCIQKFSVSQQSAIMPVNFDKTQPPTDKTRTRRNSSRARKSAEPKPRRASQKKQNASFKQKLLLSVIEVSALVTTIIFVILWEVGLSANQFSGTAFFSNILPFATGILGIVLIVSILLIGWNRMRRWSQLRQMPYFAPTLAVGLALASAWSVTHDRFTIAYGNFRTLIGGKEEAARVTIAHQVYAAYRRHNPAQLQIMISRAQPYRTDIEAAARAFGIDAHLLHGIAATESSFLPRDSHDGGKGLFQITRVPEFIITQAIRRLNTARIVLDIPRHNAFVAAATFKHYMAEMKNDLFLGLLAYNIGPANGGLRFIMQQYGASDFTTIQPYLQTLPRDYPIRVLTYALAFRLWHLEGRLPAYEEGSNALSIQRIGIPGLHP